MCLVYLFDYVECDVVVVVDCDFGWFVDDEYCVVFVQYVEICGWYDGCVGVCEVGCCYVYWWYVDEVVEFQVVLCVDLVFVYVYFVVVEDLVNMVFWYVFIDV